MATNSEEMIRSLVRQMRSQIRRLEETLKMLETVTTLFDPDPESGS